MIKRTPKNKRKEGSKVTSERQKKKQKGREKLGKTLFINTLQSSFRHFG